MKLAIIICIISTILFFTPLSADSLEEYVALLRLKATSFWLMIGSLIFIVIMW